MRSGAVGGSANPAPPIKPEPPSQAAAPAVPAAAMPVGGPAPWRLIIDQDPVSGSFIYKFVDPDNGKVVLQLPREQLVRLRDEYASGRLLNTKA